MQGPAFHPPAVPKQKSGMSTVLIVVLVLLGVFVVGGAVLATLAVYGIRKFNRNVKIAEANNTVRSIARGASLCAGGEDEPDNGPIGDPPKQHWKGLPATTTTVPASPADVAGKKYRSTDADWSSESWKCIHLDMTGPQHLQYRWTRRTETEGIAEAHGDLDGDGKTDFYVAQEVLCTTADGRTTCSWYSPLIVKEGPQP